MIKEVNHKTFFSTMGLNKNKKNDESDEKAELCYTKIAFSPTFQSFFNREMIFFN